MAAVQILEGLCWLQAAYVLHRDLNPGNIMVAVCAGLEISLQISDFGTAVKVKPMNVPSHKLWLADQRCVTTHAFAPPESLDLYRYTFQSDLWSLGIILAESLEGIDFSTKQSQPAQTQEEIRICEVKALAELAISCAAFHKKYAQFDCFADHGDLQLSLPDFCKSMLRNSPANRPPGAQQALQTLLILQPQSKTELLFSLRDPRRHRLTKKTDGNAWHLPFSWRSDMSKPPHDHKNDEQAKRQDNSASFDEQRSCSARLPTIPDGQKLCQPADASLDTSKPDTTSDVWHALYPDSNLTRINWEEVAADPNPESLLQYSARCSDKAISMYWAKPVDEQVVREHCERVFKLAEGVHYQPGNDVF